MTYGISKSLLPPAAINTSQLWEDLAPHAQQQMRDVFGRRSRWDHARSPSRRAKSHSPSRRSPKIKHTNGRLDEDPIAAAAVLLQSEAGVPRSCEDKEQLLARLRPIVMVPTPSRVTKERGMSESEIPKRALIRRSITAAPRPVRALEPSSSPTRQLKACYRDDALRERSAENTRRMIVLARQRSAPTSPQADCTGGESASSNQQKLALKALKYRKLLARAREIDEARLTDPTFDVLEGLGVKWSKAS